MHPTRILLFLSVILFSGISTVAQQPGPQFWRKVGCEPFEDGLFEWAVEYLGGDRLVLATDSPHWDSSVPGTVTGPVAKSTKISPENKRKVLGENAIDLLALGL